MLIVLDLEVLQDGPLVGKTIGNPLTLESDGTVPNILLFLISVDNNQCVCKPGEERGEGR